MALLLLAGISFMLFRLLGGAQQLRRHRNHPEQVAATQIEELTEHASRLRARNKYTNAEKVYLQILKIDHRHVQTYSRLGTLYSAMKNQPDAIECFQMATQLSPSAQTFYNLGLAYYESRNPEQAIVMLEKSIMFEPSVQRYVGLAKAFNRVDDPARTIEALERAAELDPTPRVLWLLADAYETAGRSDDLFQTYLRIKTADPRDKRLRALPKDVLKSLKAAATNLEKTSV